MNNSNKVALITGCSSGFGYLAALKFARRGYRTFASVRDTESAGSRKLLEMASGHQLPLEVLKIDVRDDQSVLAGVSAVLGKSGRIDVLVNNAGFGYLGPVEAFTIEEVKDQYETNLFGTLRMVKAVVPAMRQQRSGLIINLSSISGLIPFPLFGIYSSSKFAVESLSESLRFELSPFGIKVVLVEPGSFLTNFALNRKHPLAFGKVESPYLRLTDSFFRRYQKAHDQAKAGLLSKIINPQKVADLFYAIAQKKNPKMRYLVGSDTHLYCFLRRVVPFSIWEWVLRKVYHW